MSKNTKKWLIGTGIVAAGAAAVGAGLRAISHYFVKIAMDRKCPGKVQEKVTMVSCGSVNDRLLELTEQVTKELEAVVQTRVEVESHDGLRLIRTLAPRRAAETDIDRYAWLAFLLVERFWRDRTLLARQRLQCPVCRTAGTG